MKKIGQYGYTFWVFFWFVSYFLLLFPFYFILLQQKSTLPQAHYVTRIWGKLFFFTINIPIEITYENNWKIDPKGVFIFCFNHFSYLDVAIPGVILKNFFAFIGKKSAKKIPLLGYMFIKLHIAVERSDRNSRAESLEKCINTLKSGRGIAIFPEGGMKCNHPPVYYPLKDGAFVMALETNTPIVPITFLDNYKIFPEGQWLVYPQKLRVLIHEPIYPQGFKLDDFREKVYHKINEPFNTFMK